MDINEEKNEFIPLLLTKLERKWYNPFTWYDIRKPMLQKEIDKHAPYLFYIDENLGAIMQPKAKAGIIRPKDKFGRKKPYENKVEPHKTIRFKQSGLEIPIILNYEREYHSLPPQNTVDAKEMHKDLKAVQINYADLDKGDKYELPSMAKVAKGLLIFGGIAILGVLVTDFIGLTNFTSFWDDPEPVVKYVTQAVKNNVTNASVIR